MATERPLPVDGSRFSRNLSNRMVFVLEVLLAGVFTFLFVLGWYSFLDPVSMNPTVYIIWYWILFASSTILAVFLAYWLGRKIFHSTETFSPGIIFRSFTIQKDTVGKQFLYMVILLFLVYIPLDVIGYTIPGILAFSANSLQGSPVNAYLMWSLGAMMPITFFVHFCVAVREEFLVRNYMIVVGEKEVGTPLALIYSAVYFGLAHFNYIFSPVNVDVFWFFPLYWGISAFIIGITAGYLFLKKRMLWPVIIAHWLNNVISSVAVRNYIAGLPFIFTFRSLYLPLLAGTVIIAILTHKTVFSAVSDCFLILKSYRKSVLSSSVVEKQDTRQKMPGDPTLRIPAVQETIGRYLLLDGFIIILLWIISLVLI
jgi:membrane protease YdiL (CAAX protease family)